MTKLNSSFMIGNVEIPHRTVLAPMAGVTNSAFRTIAKEFGAGLVVMEMISEKGLLYNNEKTLHMLHIDENEHPMSIQLFGGDAEGLKRAADFIQTNTKADIVDINMGCPVNKVVKNEAGAKWLKDPDKIYHIVKEVTSVLDIPLTVKMRTGWSNSDLAVEMLLRQNLQVCLPSPCMVVPVNKCTQVTVIMRLWPVLLRLSLRFHLSEMVMFAVFKMLSS